MPTTQTPHGKHRLHSWLTSQGWKNTVPENIWMEHPHSLWTLAIWMVKTQRAGHQRLMNLMAERKVFQPDHTWILQGPTTQTPNPTLLVHPHNHLDTNRLGVILNTPTEQAWHQWVQHVNQTLQDIWKHKTHTELDRLLKDRFERDKNRRLFAVTPTFLTQISQHHDAAARHSWKRMSERLLEKPPK